MSRDDSPVDRTGDDPLLPHVASVLSAYVGNHDVAPGDLAALARAIRAALSDADVQPDAKPVQTPAVPIAESVTDERLYCLEDGKPFQSLKRHLRVAFGLTPDQYREKWGLPADYPMVAPAYARRRSELARKSGLGKSSSD